MDKIEIIGNNLLSGDIHISGAKNSAVALLPAALLSNKIVKVYNVPDITDVRAIIDIIEYLGGKVEYQNETITIDNKDLKYKTIPEKMTSKLRASYYFMSSLLAKFKYVEMYFPGGCKIGARPIDQTLKAYKSLNATVLEKNDRYIIKSDKLIGNKVYLDMPSVGATLNTIIVSVLSEGITIIDNAAKEPEIVNVATFLNNLGAKITGAGTSTIRIEGVKRLNSGIGEVIPDRIEAGTYLIAGALIGKALRICDIIPEHIETLILKLKEAGTKMKIGSDYILISRSINNNNINVKTLGYPGFPTDLQQPLTVFLTQCNGISILEETIYENRFQNVKYLNNMGANIKINSVGNKITVKGSSHLKGKTVVATDLRAGACMVLAALIADGKTTIKNIEHVLRGYENIVSKLSSVGAKIKLIK